MPAIALFLAAAAFAAQDAGDETALENAIRQALEQQQHQVHKVEMGRVDADNLAGFADIRDRDGHEGQLRCTARRNANGDYDFQCLPAITEDMVETIENEIRTALAQQASVLRVDMSRQDDMRMNGYALLRTSDGAEVRTLCTALREAPESRNFNWDCHPQE